MLRWFSPAAQQVHPNRHETTTEGHGLKSVNVRSDSFNRGVFEKRYGIPTDIDAVWVDRDTDAEGRA